MQAIPRFSRSSSFVLGVAFTLLLAIGIYFAAYFLFVASDDLFLRESKVAIRAEFNALEAASKQLTLGQLKNEITRKVDSPDSDYIYLLVDAEQGKLAGNLPAWPSDFAQQYDFDLFRFQIAHTELALPNKSARPTSDNYDLMTKVGTLDDGSRLLVARNVDDFEVAQFVAQNFGWLMIGILMLVSSLSLWVAYYVFKRINDMAQTASDIMQTGDLSTRLPIDSSWDDLSHLAVALNRMLDEIEHLVLGIKSVSDNIAHDLRTPVTRLRADIDGLSDEKNKYTLIKEVDNILSIFNGLLRISEIESGRQKSAFAQQELNLIVQDVVELYSALAEDKHIALSVEVESIKAVCDRDMLFQAFANIIDNAIKFTPAHSSIHIILKNQGAHAEFMCIDSGIGIPQQYRESVLQRFFRVEKSRTTSGNGLGLAMVAAIVNLHQGTIELNDADQTAPNSGLLCKVKLPLMLN